MNLNASGHNEAKSGYQANRGVIERYGHLLNLKLTKPPITLYEGATPLIPLDRLAKRFDLGANLYAKFEGLNPTGSFKDRGMTAAVSQAFSDGANHVICASTGNTAASAAAYAARAGMKCTVLIPDGKVALGKLSGALAYGARVVSIRGNFDQALEMVVEAGKKWPVCVVNSLNPARIEGQKTAAWEICEELGNSPDFLALPVGNAGNITAYWAGFACCGGSGCSGRPKMIGVQAAGAAPLVLGHPVENPETVASAIRIGRPARGQQALAAVSESGGELLSVEDEEILEAYGFLAQLEGVFCEPSSATGLAGVLKLKRLSPLLFQDKVVVVVLTGMGLKDPETVQRRFVGEKLVVNPQLDSLEEIFNP